MIEVRRNKKYCVLHFITRGKRNRFLYIYSTQARKKHKHTFITLIRIYKYKKPGFKLLYSLSHKHGLFPIFDSLIQ